MASGVLIEKVTGTGGTVQWNNYLFAGGQMIGAEIERTGEAAQTR